jgi:hypothetical protein
MLKSDLVQTDKHSTNDFPIAQILVCRASIEGQ